MEEKYKEAFENARKFISIIARLLVATGSLIFYLFLIFGAFASLFLVSQLLPQDFASGVVLFYPIWKIVLKILFFLLGLLFGSLVGYGIARFGFWYYYVLKRADYNQQERIRIKRREDIKEIVDEIEKKLKRKKK